MPRDLKRLRNIGIIAHIDAGKTTVTERMLFYSGTTHRMGEVDKGTTVTDFDPEEQQRGITIQSACVTFEWKDISINLIDTPGHVDFTAEVERSLRVLDGGVVVFSAREGVEAQSETVWRQADKYHVPRIAFINKMDREGADFYGTFDEIRDRLEAHPIALQIPVGAGPPHIDEAYRGIIDLVAMKYLTFTSESKGAEVEAHEIPEEMAEDAELWRGEMLSELFNYDNELAETMLAEEPISEELIHAAVRKATLSEMIVPVFCGSALDFSGIQPLLDAVGAFLPSPADMPPVDGIQPKKKDAPTIRKPKADEPFCGLVFKIQADKHGDLHYVRVYSGELKSNSRVLNPRSDKKENVSQLWHVQADRREQIPSVEAGDIVGVIGLRNSITGDTICHPQHPIQLETIVFPQTVMSMAIEPETSAERKKLADALDMLRRQDPTFEARENEDTGQTLIFGMGELHLEILKHRLERDMKVNVRVHKPRVSYRETIRNDVEVSGGCHRQIAGQDLAADLTIRATPLADSDSPVSVGSTVVNESIPAAWLDAAKEVLAEQASGGGRYGYPLMAAQFTITAAKGDESTASEVAFRLAAADAYNQLLEAADIVLLEPIMRLEIITPEEHVGDFVGDLQQRHAEIEGTETRGKNTLLTAKAPLANLFGYSSAMRGLSQGRASCTMEPCAYGPAPPDVVRDKTF